MRTAKIAIFRWALIGCLGLIPAWELPIQQAQAAAPPERILPDTTVFMVKLIDAKSFREAFRGSQYGQLWNDPALKDFREELGQKLAEATKDLKEKIGVSVGDLIQLPQGTLAVAGIVKEAARDEAAASGLPVDGVLLADAGENEKKMLEVLERATKQGETSGAKILTESFNGLTIHIIQFPPRSQEKTEKAEKAEKDKKPLPDPPLIWTNSGSMFFIATDLEIIKDLAAHRDGRENSLAATEAYAKTQAKTDSAKSQVIWYLDVAKLVKVVIKANSREADAQQTDVLVQELGVYGLKSIGGCLTLGGTGSYDSLSKTFVHAPRPVAGLLKVFSLPPITLRPESWVPATVASYQTVSFDLDNAFTALNEIANKFQPGMVNLIEQQLVGPNGGQPLSFQNDVFGPLGDRVTVISDFKKPIKEDSQRMLVAVALEDAKAFQNTLSRLLELTGAAPQKREFQGTTIYDFDLNLPNQAVGAPQALSGPISIAIAKDTLFLTSDTTLLEQVLRPGNPTLADSASFQSIAKEFPEKASGLSYVRPDESARLSYDLVKSGKFEKAIQQAAATRGGAEIPNLGKIIPGDKLPDFSVFAKYLSLGGGFSLMDEDGFTMTGFTLRRPGP
jgi:Protein of unknown function (DUF3352)